MANVKPLLVCLVLTVAGCATNPVVKGAIIGGASGAALGAGTGALISNEDLLGSSKSKQAGNLALHPGSTIGVTTLIGAFFGTLVGAMVGHAHDDHDDHGDNNEAAPAAQADDLRPVAF